MSTASATNTNFTPDQHKAIAARGDTLVIAGAGAGKTGTLVERCIQIVLGAERVSVSKILVVTFTEAAAAEVRGRIRTRLEQAAATAKDNWALEQLAGLDTAHICTLHSFCLALLKENFHALDLDPTVSVVPAEQAEMLFHEVFEQLLNEHFAGEHEISGELQKLIGEYFGGWEKRLRDFIQKLHHYTQTRPEPEKWFNQQITELSGNGVQTWRHSYSETVQDWCRWWMPYLASLPVENENAQACAELLRKAVESRDTSVVAAVLARRDCWPKGKKTAHAAPFSRIFDDAEFLDSLREEGALEKDWEWNREPLLVILKFAQQFSERYHAAKRARGMVDFHDLEQCALKLLWAGNGVTPVARRWRDRLDAVFVDEYQDINAAQDLIIQAVSRDDGDGTAGNRFLVGDIKQSIYAFRQANPSIFRGYLLQADKGANWRPFFLSDNFRSHEGILKFINPVFSWLMREQVGGIDYDEQAALKFGARERRTEMALRDGEKFPVELHLHVASESEDNCEEQEDGADLESAEQEARIVAERLQELKQRQHHIFHQKEKVARPVEWRDMVVLLRAASAKVEVYAKAFAAMGVPLETKRDGFFSAQEVLDLCNLLTILDNPLQDIPMVAVLRSPLVGLTAAELASVRLNAPKSGTIWAALNLYLKKPNATSARIEKFITSFHRWRDPRQCFSLAQKLEGVLAETGYAEWLLSRAHGRQRYANVQQLLRVARQFDDARGESLYLFLRHIQELQETAGDIEPASISETNAVRLMTVHQSKGMEFPVVAVADLGKKFNTSDQNSPIVLHEKYGVCATIKSPDGGAPYPSLPLWLAGREMRLNSIGEEMRVLYVALTRAENLLLLFGSATEKQAAGWTESTSALAGGMFPQQLLKTRSWLDWIGTHASQCWPGCFNGKPASQDLPVTVAVHREVPKIPEEDRISGEPLNGADRQALLERLAFNYPHTPAVREPAKTSVSAIRRRSDLAEEAAPPPRRFVGTVNLSSGSAARKRGVASHTFLQHVDLNGDFAIGALQHQAADMTANGVLDEEELSLIDWESIGAFWTSEIGQELRRRKSELRRELPFTFKLMHEDFVLLQLENVFPVPPGEFIVTQGVADLVLLGREEIWLFDFKTDAVSVDETARSAKDYRGQIMLYALALERIYKRPVTRRSLYFLGPRKLEWID